MPDLSLHLLGPPLLNCDGRSVQGLRRKAIALLAYLSVDHQPHSRDALATLLWPDNGQSRARANLRRCLFSLNRAVGANVLTADADTLRIDNGEITIDVETFRRLAAGCGRHESGRTCENCLPLLKEAESLYQNDFLFGFTLPDCNDFDEWQLIQSERLRTQLAELLRTLIHSHEDRNEPAHAIVFAERLLSLDPLEESSHRLLMRLYALNGRRAAAYRQYENCVRILSSELGEEPEEATEELYAAIRNGRVKGRKDATEEIPKPEKDRHGPAHESTIVSDGGREVAILAAAADDPSHLAHLEDIVRRAGEQPVNGDVGSVSFHALFPTVAAAIGAALQAQIDTDRALRLAIHMARTDPFVSGCRAEDLEHANVLLSSVPAGEIIISSAAAVPDPKRQPFPSGISLRSLGYHRLADLGSAETLYQALHPHHIRTAPVLRTLDSVRNNLPSQSEPLIGREQALNQIATAIAHPETRVLTLTGPAGTGKTRLALHAAARSTHLFEDGVFLVDLAPISDPRDLGRIIAATLEIRESMGKPRSHGAILTDYLRTRNLLLVLDNFEHLLPAANTIAQLLATAPGVKALVTSRQKLEISVEHEYRVPPLTLPQPMADLEMLFRSESVRLFLSRAVVSRPEIALDPHTVRAIGEICIRLDGLPLAIELAAARLNVVSPADLAAMLPQRLGLLKTQTRDRPHRQQTLQRAIDWSYDLLDEPERRLFANVSVFVGGWTLEAAEVVCSLTGLSDESFDVLEGISSLVNKNLIRMAKHSRDSRFSMLETIREYSLLKFNASPNTNLIRQKHAEYFLGLAEQAEPHLHGPNQMEWFDRLESDYENFQVALKWYVDTHKRYEATRICISLEWYWYRYAHLGDGKAWLRTILAPDIGGEEPASNSMVLGAVSPEEEIERTRATGRALRALGWILLVQGDWSSARDRYVESLRIARVTGDRRNESLALSGLGTAERWLGETADGMAHVEASVQLARDLRDPLLIELALIWAYSTTGGKFTGPPPINELKEALELSRRLGDLWSEAHTFNGLGDLYTQMGDYKAARTNYERALQSFRELKDRWLIAWNLEGLARVAILDSDFQSACRTVQESIQLFDELGDQANAVFMLGWLGTAFHQAGNDASAACFFGAFHSFEPTMPISAEFAPANKTVAAASAASRAAATESWEAGYAMSYDQALAFAVAECASLTRQLTP